MPNKHYGSISLGSSDIQGFGNLCKQVKSKIFMFLRYVYRFPFPPFYHQFPSVKIIFIILFLHRIHFYSIFNFINHLDSIRGVNTHVNEYSAGTSQAVVSASILLSPLPGLVADKYFPRIQVISFCLLLSFIGSSIQSMFHTLFELSIVPVPEPVYFLIHILAIVLLVLGSSGIFALLLPVGLDQMEGAGESKLKSYFNWHYWIGNFGYLFAFGRYIIYTDSLWDRLDLLGSSYLATLSIFLALVVLKVSTMLNLLQWNKPVGTPLRQILGVVYWGFRNKRDHRSESRYSQLSLFDYAAKENGGRFYYDEIFDVKTFLKILFVILNMTWYFGVYNLLNTEFPLQGRKVSCAKDSFSASFVISFGDCLVIAILLPFFELFRWKFNRIGFTKILYKFQLGATFALIAVLCAFIVNIILFATKFTCSMESTDSLNLPIILPQMIFIGLSECFAWVGAMEFVYAQSPHNMKGFTFGILQSITGIGWFIPNIVYFILFQVSSCGSSCNTCAVHVPKCFTETTLDFVYYTVFLVITTVYVVVFWLISCCYKRRERQRIENWPEGNLIFQ